MGLIPLKGKYGVGRFAKVDDKWAGIVRYHWTVIIANGKEYVVWKTTRKGLGKTLYLHRLILGAPKGSMVDHINGDTYDYRMSNLRIVTNSQNQMNAKRRSDNDSGYKGVTWNKQRRAWKAQIRKDGRDFFIGYFDNPRHAAYAYDINAREIFGEYARVNLSSAIFSQTDSSSADQEGLS